ncbi:MAG TPA: RodZ domain-containing protein [Steroidobacteraceae bacterium]|nr:RodZ domain-containing protein [Steroidobacteraceae bacterium]
MSEGIGARLRGARERKRLTILQAAERLHVDPDILEALEAENFAKLGAPVYVKGHLRHYAELVGESPEALSELYSQGTRVPPPDLTRVPKPMADDTGRLVAPAVIVVIGFAVAGTVWWGLSLSHRHWLIAASGPVPITVPAATPEPDQPVKLTVAGDTASAATRPTGGQSAAAHVPAHGDIEVIFVYSANSWTEVHDATGRRLLYGLSLGRATRRLEGVPPLSVLLGDASGVTLEVGGRPESFSPFVRADHTAWFLIAADGRVLAAPRKNGG